MYELKIIFMNATTRPRFYADGLLFFSSIYIFRLKAVTTANGQVHARYVVVFD